MKIVLLALFLSLFSSAIANCSLERCKNGSCQKIKRNYAYLLLKYNRSISPKYFFRPFTSNRSVYPTKDVLLTQDVIRSKMVRYYTAYTKGVVYAYNVITNDKLGYQTPRPACTVGWATSKKVELALKPNVGVGAQKNYIQACSLTCSKRHYILTYRY